MTRRQREAVEEVIKLLVAEGRVTQPSEPEEQTNGSAIT
jgi:hypothetical protein